MPKISPVLTIGAVKALANTVGAHTVGGAPGLLLRVKKSTAGDYLCYWILRKQGANSFYIHLGRYPDMGLKEARDAAIEALRSGNPIEARKRAKNDSEGSVAPEDLTIGESYLEFFDWKEKRGDWKHSEKARYKEQIRFEKHLLEHLRNVKYSECAPEHIANAIRGVWVDSVSTSGKLLITLRQMFIWAANVKKARQVSLINPADQDAIKFFLPSQKVRARQRNFPFLLPEQVPPFFCQLYELAKESDVARMLICAVLTCSRANNIRHMRWDCIDLNSRTWTIPMNEMKVSANGQHIVPLSDQVVEMIQVQAQYKRCEFVFPSRNDTAYSDMTMQMFIRRMHAAEVKSGRQGWIDLEQSKERGEPVVAVQHAISRASFETWARGEQKESRIIELCLHHIVDKRYNGAYDRDQSLELKRQLLQEWADFCCSELAVDTGASGVK